MAAGLGFKDFTTGEVLTAADVDGYLMQGIWVFANATARDAAVTSPQEGNFAFTKDNNSLWYYDGATWVASGATGDIEGVTAGVGISGGGTSGTVTITNSMATAIDAKGDLVAGTGADTFSRIAVGADATVLTADSSTATGLKWASAGASFSGASVHNSGNQSIANSTETIALFGSEYFDTDNYHSTSSNTGRLTIPAGKSGKYLLIGRVWFDVNATGYREMRINKNGSLLNLAKWNNNGSGIEVTLQLSVIVNATAGDYYELTVTQNRGGSLDLLGTGGNPGCNQFDIYYLGA
jgi:hypothetical protein